MLYPPTIAISVKIKTDDVVFFFVVFLNGERPFSDNSSPRDIFSGQTIFASVHESYQNALPLTNIIVRYRFTQKNVLPLTNYNCEVHIYAKFCES